MTVLDQTFPNQSMFVCNYGKKLEKNKLFSVLDVLKNVKILSFQFWRQELNREESSEKNFLLLGVVISMNSVRSNTSSPKNCLIYYFWIKQSKTKMKQNTLFIMFVLSFDFLHSGWATSKQTVLSIKSITQHFNIPIRTKEKILSLVFNESLQTSLSFISFFISFPKCLNNISGFLFLNRK